MSIQQTFEINKIHNMDCLEGLKQLENNSVDCIITDPPYGDNSGYGRKGKEIERNCDEVINLHVMPFLYDKLKMDGVCFVFTNWKFAFDVKKYALKHGFVIRMLIVIVKNNIGMGYGFRNQYELCWVFEKGKPIYKTNSFSNVQFMKHIEHDEDTHPHQKCLDMIKKMILHTTNDNDLILDPFMGSGTTAVACKQLGRNFIGFELDEKYVGIANDRLKQDNLKRWFE